MSLLEIVAPLVLVGLVLGTLAVCLSIVRSRSRATPPPPSYLQPPPQPPYPPQPPPGYGPPPQG